MPTLPAELMPLIVGFASLLSKPVWEHAQILLAGAILALGKRTVTSCLHIMGKSQEIHFQNYQRVLNRTRWWQWRPESPREYPRQFLLGQAAVADSPS